MNFNLQLFLQISLLLIQTLLFIKYIHLFNQNALDKFEMLAWNFLVLVRLQVLLQSCLHLLSLFYV